MTCNPKRFKCLSIGRTMGYIKQNYKIKRQDIVILLKNSNNFIVEEEDAIIVNHLIRFEKLSSNNLSLTIYKRDLDQLIRRLILKEIDFLILEGSQYRGKSFPRNCYNKYLLELIVEHNYILMEKKNGYTQNECSVDKISKETHEITKSVGKDKHSITPEQAIVKGSINTKQIEVVENISEDKLINQKKLINNKLSEVSKEVELEDESLLSASVSNDLELKVFSHDSSLNENSNKIYSSIKANNNTFNVNKSLKEEINNHVISVKSGFRFQAEYDYSQKIYSLIAKELHDEVTRLSKYYEEQDNYRNFDPESFREMQRLINWKHSKKDELNAIRKEPYFMKVEYASSSNPQKLKTVYIGKREFWYKHEKYVQDWRENTKIQMNNTKSFRQNNTMNDIFLRRRFSFNEKELVSFVDEYSVSEVEASSRVIDPFLRDIIRKSRDKKRVTDIIETVQANQFEIIQDSKRVNRIIEGCAGSGKTMVMLHRLSYQLFNHLDNNVQVKVVVPSEKFINDINQLRIDLQINNIKVYTIEDFYKETLLSYCPNLKFYNVAEETKRSLTVVSSNLEKHFQEMEDILLVLPYLLENSKTCNLLADFSDLYGKATVEPVNFHEHLLRVKELINIAEIVTESENIIEQYKVFQDEVNKTRENIHDFRNIMHSFLNSDAVINQNIIMQISKIKTLLTTFNYSPEQIDKYISYTEDVIDQLSKCTQSALKDNFGKFRVTSLHFMSLLYNFNQLMEKAVTKEINQEKKTIDIYMKELLDDIVKLIARHDKLIEKSNTQKNLIDELVVSIINSDVKGFLKISEHKLLEGFEPVKRLVMAFDFLLRNQKKYDLSVSLLPIKAQDSKKLWEDFPLVAKKHLQNMESKEKVTGMILKRCFNTHYDLFADNSIPVERYTLAMALKIQTLINTVKVKNPDFILIDEAQDILVQEFMAINEVFTKSIYEFYGDPNQFIGQKNNSSWDYFHKTEHFKKHQININYRNPNIIIDYVREKLSISSMSMGLEYGSVIEGNESKLLSSLFDIKEEMQKSRSIFLISGKTMDEEGHQKVESFISLLKDSVGLELDTMTIEQVKGREFDFVFVFDKNMSKNEKYIAYTRSLEHLFILI